MSKKSKIAIIHPSLTCSGAGCVAVWTIEALKAEYALTLFVTKFPDIEKLNKFFGSNLKQDDFSIRLIPSFSLFGKPLFESFLLTVNLAQRYYKKHSKEFDLVISTYSEMDFGEIGIQYIYIPTWDDTIVRETGQLPMTWFHRNSLIRKLYKQVNICISGFSEERMKQNMTLVTSNWTGVMVRRVYGINSHTIYPPVQDRFPEVPWEDREEGFVCVGTLSPVKKIERVIEIIKMARIENPKLHLHIIGNAPDLKYKAKIQHICAQNSDWIFLEGGLYREELSWLVSNHKFGIHGMLQEHFGITVAEMVKAGCIPFVPNGGGQIEIVNDSRLTYDSIENAVEKISAVLRNKILQKSLLESLSHSKHKFSKDCFIKSMREIVRNTLDK